MTSDPSFAVIDQTNKMTEQNLAKNMVKMQEVQQLSADEAVWRAAQNNAMAKLKGFNTIAKAANELS